jgi:DNA-binding response OmpR family regulator
MPEGTKPSIFAVTGWGSEQDKKLSAEAGFDKHLTKPIDLNEAEKLLAA